MWAFRKSGPRLFLETRAEVHGSHLRRRSLRDGVSGPRPFRSERFPRASVLRRHLVELINDQDVYLRLGRLQSQSELLFDSLGERDFWDGGTA